MTPERAAPAGFRAVPGADRRTTATRVFEVERAGERLLCKRLASRALSEAWARDRLAAEGLVLARLGGRGAPRLVDAGQDDRGPWLVMARLEGTTLAEHAGVVDPGWTRRAAAGVFECIAQVHERGVVHADLSPNNVIVRDVRESGGDGTVVKLVDFGLARWQGSAPLPPGPFRGTLLYAAPELARGEAVDARADLFAAAASLLHMYSGLAPRAQTTDAAMLLAAGDESVAAWAKRASTGLPDDVREALCACCAFERADRPSAASLQASGFGQKRGSRYGL